MQYPEVALCPLVDDFWVQGGILTRQNLRLYIWPETTDTSVIENAGIYIAEMSRYFNPREYKKLGYQRPISIS